VTALQRLRSVVPRLRGATIGQNRKFITAYLSTIMDGGPVAHAPHQLPHKQCDAFECLGAHWQLLRKDHNGMRLGIASSLATHRLLHLLFINAVTNAHC